MLALHVTSAVATVDVAHRLQIIPTSTPLFIRTIFALFISFISISVISALDSIHVHSRAIIRKARLPPEVQFSSWSLLPWNINVLYRTFIFKDAPFLNLEDVWCNNYPTKYVAYVYHLISVYNALNVYHLLD